MTNPVQDLILNVTGAEAAYPAQTVQRLWSGYGEIIRYRLLGSGRSSVIVKHVKLAGQRRSVSFSHRRKLRSYQIEMAWYRQWSGRCDDDCRVPECLGFAATDNELLIVLEDLDAAGFSGRRSRPGDAQIAACLRWLANFHATFINESPTDLWPIGTYWHLDTRPDELAVLQDVALKNAAAAIDQKLRRSPYQTIVHGDAKLANFCFSEDGQRVAAVDFQYVGGGCGVKDVAYFIDSCLDGKACQQRAAGLLDIYFNALKQALRSKAKPVDADAVEHDWRALYPLAWTDFHRFLKGWSPGHWDADSYSERMARQVIAELASSPEKSDAFVGD